MIGSTVMSRTAIGCPGLIHARVVSHGLCGIDLEVPGKTAGKGMRRCGR